MPARSLATDIGDTIKRIDGTEVPLIAPWLDKGAMHAPAPSSVALKDTPEAVVEAPKPVAEPEKKAEAAPEATPQEKAEEPVAVESPETKATEGPGTKPKTLEAARDDGPDDLKLIKGVGPKLEKLLYTLGFYHFDQVAEWTADEVAWVDQNLEGFKGRVSRDDWVAQAKILAAGGETEFSARKKN